VKEQKQEHHVPHRSSGAVPGHGEGSHGVPRTTLKKLLLPLQTYILSSDMFPITMQQNLLNSTSF